MTHRCSSIVFAQSWRLAATRFGATNLELLVNDEVEIECPRCDTSLFVVFGDEGHFATHEDYATKTDVAKTPLLPATPDNLKGIGRRLYNLSTEAGQRSVAAAVTHVFGRATCTECGRTLRVSDEVERASMRRPLFAVLLQLATAALTVPLRGVAPTSPIDPTST